MAGGMAHDFNNLLQAILGYVSLARMSAEPGSKTESLLAKAEKSSERARELGTQLLTFANGGVVFMKPAAAGQLIREGVEAGLDSTSKVKPLFDLPGNLPLVTLDADQIKLVVANLVSNAREATPQGGALYVSASAVALSEENQFGLLPGEYLHFLFEDSGVGIPPENLPKIFDPYFSTKEMGSQKGVGLGLALCHSIIKHHRGHIHAESRPGKGTVIHIYLPVYHPSGLTP